MAKMQLHDLARLGAQARLDAIDAERAEILKMFPDLHQGPRPARAASPARRRRGTMSPEARKAQSERMRAYWAARREAGSEGARGAAGARRRPSKTGGRRRSRR
jgi:hypothetical protein